MEWIKSHKLVMLLVGIIIVLSFYAAGSAKISQPRSSAGSFETVTSGTKTDSVRLPQAFESAPVSEGGSRQRSSAGSTRLVITESTMSLLVSDVVKTENEIISHAKEAGGYMVNTAYSKESDLPSAKVSIRVPSEKVDSSLSFIRLLGLKVIDENIMGTDITDEYTDIQARLDTLQQAHAKLRDLLATSSKPEDVLTVQQALLDIQQQIDGLNGQKQAFEQNAKLSKITVYISTDELALPYAPEHVFRPGAIFKQAVRSMLSVLQFLGQIIIWFVVYAPLIAVAVMVYRLINKLRNRKKVLRGK